MLLSEVLDDVEVLDHLGPLDVPITGVAHDSGAVTPGNLFCCLRGATSDGHDHAHTAVAAGAAALLCERSVDTDPAVSEAIVADARRAMPYVAAAFWGHPARALRTVGVTGTAGKTTTVSFVASVLTANGWSCATIGTLTGARTTPEATELHAILAGHVADGTQALAMEVSSPAIVQHRVDAICFDVSVFTNLGHDHLDVHGDQESYFAAKAQLFDPARTRKAVICVDDAWGVRLADAIEQRGGVGLVRASVGDAVDAQFRADGTSTFLWRGEQVVLQLAGQHNLTDAVLAAHAGEALGVAPAVVAKGLTDLPGVPGHFELVRAGQPFVTVVDFAHTPDAVAAALTTARGLVPGRVIVVLGCGGDRDRLKRPLMAAAAEAHADVAIFTSDNPRSENPLDILAEMVEGLQDKASVRIEEDRAAAISLAVEEARPGDAVLIAGKGHETTQTFADRTEHFDDREVAIAAIRERGYTP